MAKSKKNKPAKRIKNPSPKDIKAWNVYETYEKKPSNKILPNKIRETLEK